VIVLRWLVRLYDWVVRSDARLSRFLLEENRFNRAQNAVKPRAFLPPSDHKLSVFGTNRLREKSIWVIGKRVANEQNKPLYARADLSRRELANHKLKSVWDEPPRLHRNIIGWPPHGQKDDLKLIAMELAAVATLRLYVAD